MHNCGTPKNISYSHTIHPAWSADGCCWFAVVSAPAFGNLLYWASTLVTYPQTTVILFLCVHWGIFPSRRTLGWYAAGMSSYFYVFPCSHKKRVIYVCRGSHTHQFSWVSRTLSPQGNPLLHKSLRPLTTLNPPNSPFPYICNYLCK